jgi:altronate hydrolase
MPKSFLQVHPDDNVLAALRDLQEGEHIHFQNHEITLVENIQAKHKFTIADLNVGDPVYMYGVLVGKASMPIPRGGRISVDNTVHATTEFGGQTFKKTWTKPDVSRFEKLTFNGYHRDNGSVGTMNFWLVIPMVFCENRNVNVIKDALLENLGYSIPKSLNIDVSKLIEAYRLGASENELLEKEIVKTPEQQNVDRLFPNVDGIKFLTHEGGCGGTREDAETLCRLLAGYVTHSNVAGATILSLGCQHAQFSIIKEAIKEFDPNFSKPVFFLEQQESISEPAFIEEAVKKTFIGLTKANEIKRAPADLRHLVLGLECGGSDGFSGISANPSLGFASDLLVALGGTAILSEFPELNGVEQELINRCETRASAEKFARIMNDYSKRAEAVGSGFENNPSPGNIKDGLITDAMKSAGAAKKGGTSPITDVLDYTEQATKKGLNLLCTPGNDVESTTGLAGSGANVIVFTTGLGTPTGNPIAPVIKLSSNNKLTERMRDLIDFNAGTVISGEESIEEVGSQLLELIIEVASGNKIPNAVRLGQDDFIPWKRGVSL